MTIIGIVLSKKIFSDFNYNKTVKFINGRRVL